MRHASVSQFALMTLVAAGALALVTSFGQGPTRSTAASAQDAPATARAILRTASGDEVAQATFTDTDQGLALSISASGLGAGFHGLHVHANAACEAPDFTSAGPHFDGSAMRMAPSPPHVSGAQTAMPPGHAGDLPSLLVNQNGMGKLTTVTDRVNVADLLAGAGTALMIHAGPDNFANIPTRYAPAPDATTLATGDAGARVACGVIQPTDVSAAAGQAS